MDDAYLMAVARRAGCPLMFTEDCAQEIRIAMWLAPAAPWKLVAKRTAIDFVRQYGAYSRSGYSRETVAIDGLRLGYVQDVDAYIDRKRAMAALPEKQRVAILDETVMVKGTTAIVMRSYHRRKGRERLRELLEVA